MKCEGQREAMQGLIQLFTPRWRVATKLPNSKGAPDRYIDLR